MIDRAAIRATLIELLEADTGESFHDLKDDDDLREGLGLDSVDVVSVISQVERKFHLRLSHDELMTLATVGDVLTLIESKINAAPPRSPRRERRSLCTMKAPPALRSGGPLFALSASRRPTFVASANGSGTTCRSREIASTRPSTAPDVWLALT